jgi:hypothetical protein
MHKRLERIGMKEEPGWDLERALIRIEIFDLPPLSHLSSPNMPF